MPSEPAAAPARRRLRVLRRVLLRQRRWIAAGAAAVAMIAVAGVVAPPPEPTAPVVVAARDLPAGARLAPQDLRVVELPVGAAPADAASVDAVVGERLAAPVAAREPVGPRRVAAAPAWVPGPGETAVPVRIPDAGVVALLSVGDEVDLVATDPQSGTSEVVARGVRVAALPAPGDSGGSDLASAGGLVVVVAPSRDATDIAGAAVRSFLSVAFAG